MYERKTSFAKTPGGQSKISRRRSEFPADINLQKLKNYAEGGQTPKAVILCCSDSRAPVEMGNTQCGAIEATLDHLESIQNVVTENIVDIISRIKLHIRHI